MICNYKKLSFSTKGRHFSTEFSCDVFLKSRTLTQDHGCEYDITEYNLPSVKFVIKHLKLDAEYELRRIKDRLTQKKYKIKIIRGSKRKKLSEKYMAKLNLKIKILTKYKKWLENIKPEDLIKRQAIIEKYQIENEEE